MTLQVYMTWITLSDLEELDLDDKQLDNFLSKT